MGIDSSWMGGLYMRLSHGKDFGTEVVFTYGPRRSPTCSNCQLVPGTTEGGMVSRDPRLDGKGGFEQLPEVRDLKIEGVSHRLHFKFYGVKVKVEAGAAG